MIFKKQILEQFKNALHSIYDLEVKVEDIIMSQTRKEFEGDYTIVVFPYVKQLRKSPKEIGDALGEYMVANISFVEGYNVIQGFLNLSLEKEFWGDILSVIHNDDDYGNGANKDKRVLVEFSSPNTNKPLHLGHLRNILLGWASSQILEAAGYDVVKTQIINDRGIAICKSMLAWQKYGDGDTPSLSAIKGDHFVGKYYVLFETKFREEYSQWQTGKGQEIYIDNKKEEETDVDFFKRYKNQYFNDYSVLGNEAKDLLLKWEAEDEQVRNLWALMNDWVYDGFEVTYDKLGVNFDKLYYESDTYLEGKGAIEDGLKKNIFYKEADGSAWVDLEDAGMDKKIVLRSDGTSVYITQDIGTAMMRHEDLKADKMVYVVADEQDYHFKVLFEIMKRLEEPYAEGMHHLSYGMVDLPSGKMKSREGTVVDADDLVEEVISEASANANERGGLEEYTQEEKNEIYEKIGIGALKYFIIKVSPKKRMTFDPKESVDMQGQTGPYIQNAYVRIQSILNRVDEEIADKAADYKDINEFEEALIKELIKYPEILAEAAEHLDPSLIANFCYDLAKSYHRFYHEVRILSAENEQAKSFRLLLSMNVATILKKAMLLLGIEMPQRM